MYVGFSVTIDDGAKLPSILVQSARELLIDETAEFKQIISTYIKLRQILATHRKARARRIYVTQPPGVSATVVTVRPG